MSLRSVRVTTSENVTLWPSCNRPCARIPRDCRSAITFRLSRAWLLLRYDQVRIRSVLRTSGKAHRDTTWHQLWTTGQYASELQRICTLKSVNGHRDYKLRSAQTST